MAPKDGDIRLWLKSLCLLSHSPGGSRMRQKKAKNAEPQLSVRRKVQISEQEEADIIKRAGPKGVSAYLRALALIDLYGSAPKKTLPKKLNHQDEVAARLITIHAELRRLGNNANQLAHQANAKIVPITGDEAVNFLDRHEETLEVIALAIQELIL
jgi:Bacterial mobilisation protein (MobC)